MGRPIIFVIKDEFKTRFMQDADLFERFKFVGKVVEAEQADSHCHQTAKEILDAYADKPQMPNFMLVGIIIPKADAAFLPNHTVFSTGTGWLTVEDMCHSYNAKPPRT